MPGFKKLFGFLLFATLMLVKVSAFHVYAHHEAEEGTIDNCEICDIALENQNSDVQLYVNTCESPDSFTAHGAPNINFVQRFKGKNFYSLFFTRPPPSIMA